MIPEVQTKFFKLCDDVWATSVINSLIRQSKVMGITMMWKTRSTIFLPALKKFDDVFGALFEDIIF